MTSASCDAPPRPYPHLLRGPRHRWWRPLVGLAVVLGVLLVLFVALLVGAVLVAVVAGVPVEGLAAPEALAHPALLLANNLLLATLVPTSLLAVWAGHRCRPGLVSSVAGRLRWGWLLECAALSSLVLLASMVVFYALDGVPQGAPERHAVVLLAVVLLTTPLQAAGEEYLTRGWMTQAIGSVLARPIVAAVVAGGVTALLFALAHGGQNLWLFLDRFAFGVLASYLTWRTGGLESAVAVHAVNNVVALVPVILTGGLAETLLIRDAPVAVLVVDVSVMVVIGALLVWRARRRGLQRLAWPRAADQPPPPPP